MRERRERERERERERAQREEREERGEEGVKAEQKVFGHYLPLRVDSRLPRRLKEILKRKTCKTCVVCVSRRQCVVLNRERLFHMEIFSEIFKTEKKNEKKLIDRKKNERERER